MADIKWTTKKYKDAGFKPKTGFQLKYIYLIDKNCKLTVPVLPFSEIENRGAKMYKGISNSAAKA